MNRTIQGLASLFLAVALISGCNGGKPSEKTPAAVKAVKESTVLSIGQETQLLIKNLEESGDYVNSREYPSLIKASVVYEGLGSKTLVIDLRSQSQYASGHITGAVNKRFADLPVYFESGIKPFEYDRIILVCEDGQASSYATSLLRLKGYGNVYAMRWGMSAWNKASAESAWLKGISSGYEDKLDTVTYQRPSRVSMPELKTGAVSGGEIADARFASLFEEGTGNVLISADEVFANPSNFFIINLERKDKYESGHIPGAMRYKPDATLGIASEMATIPADKIVVLYCGTGHNSAFATAYLRLFGYDARTLSYGNQGFMYDRMKREKATLSWVYFSDADINDYKTVK
jgi:rhodanese-related sulfurtransferase